MHTEDYLTNYSPPPPPPPTTSHKAMTKRTLMRWAQIVRDTPNSSCDKNKYLKRVFHKNNYNAVFIKWNIYRPTKADGTNRNPTPVTTVNRFTLRALLRPSHGSYSPTTSMWPTNLLLHYNTYWPMLKTVTNSTTDREQSTRSNALTARLPALVRLAEALNTRLTEHIWAMSECCC